MSRQWVNYMLLNQKHFSSRSKIHISCLHDLQNVNTAEMQHARATASRKAQQTHAVVRVGAKAKSPYKNIAGLGSRERKSSTPHVQGQLGWLWLLLSAHRGVWDDLAGVSCPPCRIWALQLSSTLPPTSAGAHGRIQKTGLNFKTVCVIAYWPPSNAFAVLRGGNIAFPS